jgi:hypothetical protein
VLLYSHRCKFIPVFTYFEAVKRIKNNKVS